MDCPQKVRHFMGAFLCINESNTTTNLDFTAWMQ